VVRLTLALTLVVGSALLFSSTDKPAFSVKDKAFYADANLVNFVRPGLTVKIVTASIASDGTIKVRFKLTDPKGLPLDISGVTTPGAVSTRFVIGTIPANQKQYISYITRSVTSPITGNSATQANSDSGGTYAPVADGEYIYTFKNKAPASFDRHATHTVGMWAARDLSEFDLDQVTNYTSDIYSWVPDGSTAPVPRDVIKDVTCNKCHDPLQAHDERRGIGLCIICHTPQTTDPDTGNTLDMPVLVHKIHMGSQLPSVIGGKPYQIIGYQQSVADYSTVVFPADPRNCTFCHDQTTGAAQATAYLKPNRAACGSCHDNVNFATGANHANLPQISDNLCAGCHIPQGELEFDVSIKGAHTIPTLSTSLPGTVLNITNVENAGAGKSPTITFTVTDNAGNAVDVSKMTRLTLVVAGPTTDYSSYFSEDARKATASGTATWKWTTTNKLPANAKGTYTVGIEGYNNVTLLAGLPNQQVVRDAGANKVFNFTVDGTAIQARRQVVSLAKCNNCHSYLSLHGGNRNQIEQCVLCHNPNTSDSTYRPAAKKPDQTVQFAYMIHRIHTGDEGTQEYTVYGFGGSANDFSEVRYPGDRRNCSTCHVDGAEQLPLADGLLNVQSARTPLNPMGPATAACLACHNSIPAASHALSNTTEKLGEACAACHASTSEFGVSKVHAR
jgi:OmcA/MtrC family decaheme c-type cytochrome